MCTTIDDVTEAMKDVIDPELGINVIDLGLVYDMRLDENNIATASLYDFPIINSLITETLAIEIEHPTPSQEMSFTTCPSIIKLSVTSSPQLGFLW